LKKWFSGLSPLKRNALWIVFVMLVLRFIIRFLDATLNSA
jgi:hypothetical protein